MTETLRSLRYLAPALKVERHDDGTATVYLSGRDSLHGVRAVTLLPDGMMTGYDDCDPNVYTDETEA
jgi:hypothetical protein